MSRLSNNLSSVKEVYEAIGHLDGAAAKLIALVQLMIGSDETADLESAIGSGKGVSRRTIQLARRATRCAQPAAHTQPAAPPNAQPAARPVNKYAHLLRSRPKEHTNYSDSSPPKNPKQHESSKPARAAAAVEVDRPAVVAELEKLIGADPREKYGPVVLRLALDKLKQDQAGGKPISNPPALLRSICDRIKSERPSVPFGAIVLDCGTVISAW